MTGRAFRDWQSHELTGLVVERFEPLGHVPDPDEPMREKMARVPGPQHAVQVDEVLREIR